MSKTFEAALSISPSGWKKIDKLVVLEVAVTASEYNECEGHQLWYWERLSQENQITLIHTLMDLQTEDYRFVWIDNENRDGTSQGEQSGPFDLMLVASSPEFSGAWVHIDRNYYKHFFEAESQ